MCSLLVIFAPDFNQSRFMLSTLRNIAGQSVWIQLLFFAIITAGSLILFAFAGQLIVIVLYGFKAYSESLMAMGSLDILREGAEALPEHFVEIMAITQISSQIGLFIVPPVALVLIIYGRRFWMKELALNESPGIFSLLMTAALVVLVLPFVSWLTEINMNVTLPSALERAEEQAEAIVTLFFNDAGWKRFILNMVMVAVIPALGEELFFRGVLQRYLVVGLKNVHLAVFLTAMIFSFFHFQFHGFLPRMLLGLIFGYLLVWTGNLWIPVAAHFINNGAAVVVEFLSQRGVISSGYQDFGHHTGTGAVLFSAITTAVICALIWFVEKKQRVIRI